ncbi:MAG: hypothetical protein ABI968_00675 [Acidobacteriota bacterium]
MERRGSLRAGFAALSHGKLILLLTLATLALGFLSAMPLLPALQHDLAGTLAGDHFIRNHPTFAPADFIDFVRERQYATAGMRRTAGAAGAFAVILQVFFAGGIVAVLGRGRFTFGQFFEPARRNFGHNVKCFLLFLLAGAVVVGGWLGGALAARKKLFEDAPPDAASHIVSWWAILLVGVLLFAILSLLYDFARAARRYSPTIGAWRAVRFAFRAMKGARLRALALFFFWLVLGGAAVVASIGLTWAMPAVSLPAVILLFLLQFGALWLRSAVRVAAWGSYIGFLEFRGRGRVALASLSGPSGLERRRDGLWGPRQPGSVST